MGKSTTSIEDEEKSVVRLKGSTSELVGSDDMDFMNILFNELMQNMFLPEIHSGQGKMIAQAACALWDNR